MVNSETSRSSSSSSSLPSASRSFVVSELLVCLFVVVDVLGFSLVLPLLPYLATEAFGATPTTVGLLMSANAIAQLIAAPFLGRLSDRFGRKPLLLLCVTGTFFSFLLFAYSISGLEVQLTLSSSSSSSSSSSLSASSSTRSTSFFLLFLSRILDGLLGGNVSLAQAYISDITTKETRAKGMGMIGAAFGIGFVFGPAIGGSLCTYNHTVPSLLAAALSILNLIGIYFFLPESLPVERRKISSSSGSLLDHSPFHAVWKASKSPSLLPLLILRFSYHLCFTMFETIFSMHNKQSLEIDARTSSYLLAFIGVLFSGIQGGIHRLAFRFENWRLISFGFLTFALSMGLWTALNLVHVSSLIPTVLAVLTPLSLSAGVLNTMINTSISTAASKEELGETLGLASSVSCFSRVLGPLLAGGLASLSGGYSNVGICTVLLCGAMFLYSRRPNLVLKLKEIAAISNSRLLLQQRVTNEVVKEKKTT